jgi:hypothetical protein
MVCPINTGLSSRGKTPEANVLQGIIKKTANVNKSIRTGNNKIFSVKISLPLKLMYT